MMRVLSVLIYFSLRIYKKSSKILHNLRYKRKIKKLVKDRQVAKLSKSHVDAISKFYSNYEVKKIDMSWHTFYAACNGRFSTGYVPENLFYTVLEPKLNDRSFSSVLGDKNLLEKLFPNARQPKTVVKNINGFFITDDGEMIKQDAVQDISEKYGTVFIKPTIETGGGKNVSAFSFNDISQNFENKEFAQILKDYDMNFIVQEKVEQHEIMSSLNPTSLNTLRVVSYLKTNEVIILSTIVRMGVIGSIIDNSTVGGFSCGVKSDGSLNETGFKLSGEKSYTTSTNIKFEGIQLPFMAKVGDEVRKLHKEVPYFKIVSWDLAIDSIGDVILIEYNIQGQDITFHQLNNGPVLAPILEELRRNSSFSEIR